MHINTGANRPCRSGRVRIALIAGPAPGPAPGRDRGAYTHAASRGLHRHPDHRFRAYHRPRQIAPGRPRSPTRPHRTGPPAGLTPRRMSRVEGPLADSHNRRRRRLPSFQHASQDMPNRQTAAPIHAHRHIPARAHVRQAVIVDAEISSASHRRHGQCAYLPAKPRAAPRRRDLARGATTPPRPVTRCIVLHSPPADSRSS